MLRDRVLLTGGSGFLARAILRKAKRENWSAEFIVYSRDELKQVQCRKKYPDARYVLGDVRDVERLKLLLLGVTTVIHTAALKYVPEGEHNVSECISVNVDGTAAVLRAAHEAGVEHVVCISTDKAVQPVNVYGATKMLVERMVGEYALLDSTKYVAVRYGNVIGSTGSVVPVMQEMARETGRVQVTDPDMTRYWLCAGEAIDCIMDALSPGTPNGSVVVYNPYAMRLADLVAAIAPEAQQDYIGLRPGEKMHETLLTDAEACRSAKVGSRVQIIPPAYVHRYHPQYMSWTSDTADRMSGEDFVTFVEDAARI